MFASLRCDKARAYLVIAAVAVQCAGLTLGLGARVVVTTEMTSQCAIDHHVHRGTTSLPVVLEDLVARLVQVST